MITGIVFDIKRFAVHDGPGIRTTIFLKGCPARCWWCHNPESQNPGIESVQKTDMLDGKSFSHQSDVGQIMSVAQVMDEIMKETVFMEESTGGVTFSGGEPLAQPDFLKELLAACKQAGLHTTLDTAGLAAEGEFSMISGLVDLYLYDLKIIDDNAHREFTGVSNNDTLQNLHKLCTTENNIVIRIPVIPGITDTKNNIDDLYSFLETLNNGFNEIDLLPYHQLANDKYRRFCRNLNLPETKTPSPQDMKKLQKRFEKIGRPVKIGG